MAEKKKILYLTSKHDLPKTKHGAFNLFNNAEENRCKSIFKKCVEEKSFTLDIQSLYPDLQIKGKLVGIFDPDCLINGRLLDFLPFYEVILCVIDIANSSSEELFRRRYGCAYNQFIKLVDKGRLIPIFSDNEYLPDHCYDFFATLLQRCYPSQLRYWYLLRNHYMNSTYFDSDLKNIYEGSFHLLMDSCSKWNKVIGLSENGLMRLFQVLGMSLTRYDFARPFLSLECAVQASLSDSKWRNESTLLSLLSQIDSICQQPYLAPGATTNYSDEFINFMSEQKGRKLEYFIEIVSKFATPSMVAQRKAQLFADSCPIFSSDRLAVLRNEYFFEPSELYDDILKYDHWLEHSDNVREHYRIAKSLEEDIKTGKLRDFSIQLKNSNYEEIIKELNREIHLIQKARNYLKIGIQFATALSGAGTGALIGQTLEQQELTLLFSFLGANAATTLATDHAKKIATEVTPKLFHRSNTAILLWRHKNA